MTVNNFSNTGQAHNLLGILYTLPLSDFELECYFYLIWFIQQNYINIDII